MPFNGTEVRLYIGAAEASSVNFSSEPLIITAEASSSTVIPLFTVVSALPFKDEYAPALITASPDDSRKKAKVNVEKVFFRFILFIIFIYVSSD